MEYSGYDAHAQSILGLAVVSDVLYCIGGFDGTNWLNVNEAYKPVGYGTVGPKVQITSPENKTYANVTLEFTVNRGTQWMGYSLDNHPNITLTTEPTLSGLSQGCSQRNNLRKRQLRKHGFFKHSLLFSRHSSANH